MTATEFKNGLKEIKESIKGLTLQLVNANGYKPYNTLKEFGLAILDEERKGNDFRINQVWTNEGTQGIKSISHLVELIKTNTVTAIQFESFWSPQSKD